MGNYTYGDYLEIFGGPPDPGDPDVVHDIDAIRDRLEYEAHEETKEEYNNVKETENNV